MVKETRLYDLLGVAPTASQDELNRAYRKRMVRYYPNKGVAMHDTTIDYTAVSRAYEVLSDDHSRRIYDAHGEDALPPAYGSDSVASEEALALFSRLFGTPVAPHPRSTSDPNSHKADS